MTAYSFQPAAPLASDGAALSRVLEQAGVTRTSTVRVTGPAGPMAAIWLERHGYEHAAYVHTHWIATMEPVDALLVPQACGTEALADLLRGGCGLRQDGILIAQVQQDTDTLAIVLRSLGFDMDHCLHEAGRQVCIARRRDFDGFKKAA
jgi:hypothetical protein